MPGRSFVAAQTGLDDTPDGILNTIIEAYTRVIERLVKCAWIDAHGVARQRDATVAHLQRARQPEYRHEAEQALADVALWSLEELGEYVFELQVADGTIDAQKAEIEQLEAQVARLQRLAQQPKMTTVTLPQRTIQVRSSLGQAVLRLMAAEGLGRSWRIQQRVREARLTENDNSVRNALRRLTGKGLIADYVWNGRSVGWSPLPGGRRRLVALTDQGRTWCRQVFGQEPRPSEVAAMAQRHNSVVHAVGILEARDHLRARGWPVDDVPGPILADEDERWGRRVEPDLVAVMGGEEWPVEVQRDVAPRYTVHKWAKILSLCGRLAIVTLNEAKRVQQARLLKPALGRLPAGEIRLASLQTMESGDWEWTPLVVSTVHR